MQGALASGDRQAVAAQGVVIHADGVVAAGEQQPIGVVEHRQPLVLVGEIGRGDLALQRQLLGQVGEGEQRNPIRSQFPHQFERGLEAFRCLQRQAADQIDVDTLEVGLANPGHRPPQLLHRHHPVHRCLHLGIGILDAEADAVEAEVPQGLDLLPVHQFGIQLDRGLQIGVEIEVLGDQVPQLGQLTVVEVVGCATAPVQLGQTAPLRQLGTHQLQFPGQGQQVGRHHLRTQLGGDAIAAAVPAGMAAEGHMHIERQRGAGWRRQLGRHGAGPHGGAEGRGGRIAGVTGYGTVVLEQQLQGAQRRSSGEGVQLAAGGRLAGDRGDGAGERGHGRGGQR